MLTFDDVDSRVERSHLNPKFFKFEEVFDYIRNKLRNAFSPGQEMSVDESLLSFYGRCGIRQYMPNKPNKYGIKIWCLVCNQSSVVCDIMPYLGKSDSRAQSGKVGEEVINKKRKMIRYFIFLFKKYKK